MPSKVIIIDYGSQVTQLIARRVREAGVYSEIHPCVVTAAQVKAMQPSAIILSGGPASVGEKDAPALDKGFLDLGVPVLGICYGMQLLAFNLGGGLEQSETREYGPADLRFVRSCALWDGIDLTKLSRVWMSHGDTVKTPPAGFLVTGSTDTLEVAAMADEARKIYAVQFHPEVHHSVDGDTMLRNFLFKIAKITPDWTMSSFVERVINEVRETVGDGHVVCALSGGVDSTVVAVLLHKAIGNVEWLAQGTLYPDVIESVSHKGPSAVIKSHHNVGGLPEKMNMKLIEPLRELFKDEVRQVGAELGMPESVIWRQPFPGPGLAIRVIGEVTRERLDILRKADTIVQQELRDAGWYRKIWQGFAVLLPLKTVGVMGDGRTYEHVIALRCVDSVDAMTADWARLPYDLLERISRRIINEVKGVNRVVYDVSSKPPSTIEWE